MIESGLLSFILILIFIGYVVCYPLVEYRTDFLKILYHVAFVGGFYMLIMVQVIVRCI